MIVRLTKQDDSKALESVVEETGLFPSELLPHMLEGTMSDTESQDIWLTCEVDGKAIGFCYAIPEEMAEGCWNMLAIAVHPVQQGKGCGSAMVTRLESELKARDQRVLIADTSGTNEFSLTREFYRQQGYAEEARIRDFWADGDDKVVFWKSLG